jgi:hypothetical protein
MAPSMRRFHGIHLSHFEPSQWMACMGSVTVQYKLAHCLLQTDVRIARTMTMQNGMLSAR